MGMRIFPNAIVKLSQTVSEETEGDWTTNSIEINGKVFNVQAFKDEDGVNYRLTDQKTHKTYVTIRTEVRPNQMFVINEADFTKGGPLKNVWLGDENNQLKVLRTR